MTTRKRRKPIGYCQALRNGARCGAPATHRWYDWLACSHCFGNGHFSSEVSVLTEKEPVDGAG